MELGVGDDIGKPLVPVRVYEPVLKGLALAPTAAAACRNPLVPVRITNRD